jgi:hypothetical protein
MIFHIYNGYAYFVNLEDVHVSFHGGIHNLVRKRSKFDVQFTFNRTPLRLFHRAVNMSPELWQKLWCPPKIKQPTRLPLQKLFGDVALNEEQKQALLTILHNSSTTMVLHGPPGTGTTFTLYCNTSTFTIFILLLYYYIIFNFILFI